MESTGSSAAAREHTTLRSRGGRGGVHRRIRDDAYWKKIGTDENGNTGTFSGATPFTAENLNLADFTALSSVTEEQVLGWIKDRVVDDYENHVNQQIQKQIDAVVNPITEATLPWAAQEETNGTTE